ncbi:hypothetical protein RBH89_08330 [Paracidovorax avenae]
MTSIAEPLIPRWPSEPQSPDSQLMPLSAGQMFVVLRGTWHRLQVVQPGRLMSVTPGRGSEHRRVGAPDAIGATP